MFGVECKIVDPETGEDLPDNVDGEFCARGYNIMKGYYKMPEATAAIDEERLAPHRRPGPPDARLLTRSPAASRI